MTINALMFSERAEVTIKGVTNKEFYDDLEKFKSDVVSEDRTFDDDRKVFYVHNVEKYLHLPYIVRAIENRKLSLQIQLQSIAGLLEKVP